MVSLNVVIQINRLSVQIPVKEKCGVHSMCLLPELLVYGGMCGIWWYGWYMVVCVVYGGVCGIWWCVWYMVVWVVYGGVCGIWWYGWYMVVCVVYGGTGGIWWCVWFTQVLLCDVKSVT